MNIAPWPSFDKEQIKAVENVLLSGKVNRWTGENCNKFEKEFSNYLGIKYSLSVANGSLALTSAYEAIGLKKGDEFITTPRTFIATSSCGVLLNGKPIFADIDRDSGSITAETIEPLINSSTKAIVVVHLGGWPAEMQEICNLAKSHGLKIIEDCSQAHGAKINNNHVGTFGDISTWSFCQDKILTTGGEGGMVTTNNNELWSKIWEMRDHGKSLNKIENTKNQKGFKWLHDSFGSNYRLTELQAAIGRIQLKRLNEWRITRERNALLLYEQLKYFEILRIPRPTENITHAWYKFYTYVRENYLSSGWNRDRIIHEINNEGVPAFSGSCSEIYLEKSFQNFGYYPKKRLPVARELGETSLMFLVHPTISQEGMFFYADRIKRVLKRAVK